MLEELPLQPPPPPPHPLPFFSFIYKVHTVRVYALVILFCTWVRRQISRGLFRSLFYTCRCLNVVPVFMMVALTSIRPVM